MQPASSRHLLVTHNYMPRVAYFEIDQRRIENYTAHQSESLSLFLILSDCGQYCGQLLIR